LNEVDQLHHPLAGPIPEDILIPYSSADVQAYLKRIAPPRAAEDDHKGNMNVAIIYL
jgi:hypothetical protein